MSFTDRIQRSKSRSRRVLSSAILTAFLLVSGAAPAAAFGGGDGDGGPAIEEIVVTAPNLSGGITDFTFVDIGNWSAPIVDFNFDISAPVIDPSMVAPDPDPEPDPKPAPASTDLRTCMEEQMALGVPAALAGSACSSYSLGNAACQHSIWADGAVAGMASIAHLRGNTRLSGRLLYVELGLLWTQFFACYLPSLNFNY